MDKNFNFQKELQILMEKQYKKILSEDVKRGIKEAKRRKGDESKNI